VEENVWRDMEMGQIMCGEWREWRATYRYAVMHITILGSCVYVFVSF
jgi:hypothetical protein